MGSPNTFSLLTAVVWFNIFVLAIAYLRRHNAFLIRYSISALVLLAGLSLIRVMLPLNLSFAHVIRSATIVPFFLKLLNMDVIRGDPHINLGAVLIAIWLIGICFFFLRTIHRIVHERKQRSRFKIVVSEQLTKVVARMDLRNACIRVTPDVSVPIVIGVFKAHIYLPVLSVTDSELEFLLTHEMQHIKSCDTLIKAFFLALAIVFWWNPVVHRFQRELDLLLELRCDANVTRNMRVDGKTNYLQSILTVIKQVNMAEPKSFVGAVALVNATSAHSIKQRFEVVLAERKKTNIAPFLLSVVIILVFILSYLVVIQPVYFPPEESTQWMYENTVVEDAFILSMEEGVFELYMNGKFFMNLTDTELLNERYYQLPIYRGGESK